jgi:hypothetical protein
MCGCVDTIGGNSAPAEGSCELVLQPIVGDNGAFITAQATALAATGGGTICLSPGTYLLDTSVMLRTNVSIKGAGSATILRWRNGHNGTNDVTDRSVFSADPATPVSDLDIYNLSIDGNFANVTNCLHGVSLNSVVNAHLRNVHIRDTQQDGVNVTATGAVNSQVVQMDSCLLERCQRDTIRLVSGAIIEITGCTSRNPVGSHLRITPALITQQVTNVAVTAFEGIDTTLTGTAAVIIGAATGVITDVSLVNLVIDTVRLGLLVGVAGALATSRIALTNCQFRGQTGAWGAALCEIAAPAVDVMLVGCRAFVTAFGVAGQGDAMRVTNASDVRLEDCRFASDTGTVGRRSLYVTGTTGANNHVLVQGCDFDGPVMYENTRRVELIGGCILCTGTTVASIWLDDVATCRVEDCVVRGGNIQVYWSGVCTDVLVANNELHEANSYAIYGADAAGGTLRIEIRGNHIRSTVAALVRAVVLAQRFVFQENYVEQAGGTAGDAVLLQTTCIVDGNIVRPGTAAISIQGLAGSTGYTCSYNRTSAPVALAGTTPAEAVFNTAIAA